MRLEENPLLPLDDVNLRFTLSRLFRAIAQKVNALGDGRLSAHDLTAASIPTTGTYAKGDFIRNSNPSELGSAASKYVLQGWICTVAGSPGTLLEVRTLTGN